MTKERYKFSIENLKSGVKTTGIGFGFNEEEARLDARDKYIDMESLDSEVKHDQVLVGICLEKGTGQNIFVCEGCSA
ncbi:hypothetical protein [Paenibacillus silviterrae]|uniref:hypothetical protein n=1 Tax=Paenibacillus silviterrae TaxID=3242194 RepID=UPI0025429FB3|nr:hypothetical protein [Paenibacillus chinjuensis]